MADLESPYIHYCDAIMHAFVSALTFTYKYVVTETENYMCADILPEVQFFFLLVNNFLPTGKKCTPVQIESSCRRQFQCLLNDILCL